MDETGLSTSLQRPVCTIAYQADQAVLLILLILKKCTELFPGCLCVNVYLYINSCICCSILTFLSSYSVLNLIACVYVLQYVCSKVFYFIVLCVYFMCMPIVSGMTLGDSDVHSS